jgi:acetyl-CoA carboxylase biotin carboxyl carrier protein
MRVEEIRRLIKLVEESQIDELEVRRWWTKVRIQKSSRNHRGSGAEGGSIMVAAPSNHAAFAPLPPAPESPAPSQQPGAVRADVAEDAGLVAIRSPMVGTFYRAPSPQSPPYVEVGQRIGVGTVVCIVEAMKLMNEIESEAAGVVEKILSQNGQPVEFNQTLFLVRPN